jgi:hypothetical protein
MMPSAIGERTTRTAAGVADPGRASEIQRFVRHLARFYPPRHPVLGLSAAGFGLPTGDVRRATVATAAELVLEMSSRHTLYVRGLPRRTGPTPS